MKSVLIFVAVCVIYVNAQAPIHCVAPPALQGVLHTIDTSATLFVRVNWTYDAMGERVRYDESLYYRPSNGSEVRDYYDTFYFFKEGMRYRVNLKTRLCEKSPIPSDEKFYRIGVPPDAMSHGVSEIGSSAGPGTGIEIALWSGESPRGGRYFGSWTNAGCLPVQELHALDNGEVFRNNFYDITIGYDPNRFIPPSNCV